MTYDYFRNEPHFVESINGKGGVVTIKGSDSMLVEKKPDGSLELKVHSSLVGGLGGGDLDGKLDRIRTETDGDDESTTSIDIQPDAFVVSSNFNNKTLEKDVHIYAGNGGPEQSPSLLLQCRNRGEDKDTNVTIYDDQININTGLIKLSKGTKVLGTNEASEEHEVIGLNEYASGEQVEVGSETIPLCLNHKVTEDWSTKNITVNYKDADGEEHVDKVAYLSDISSPPEIDYEVLTGKTFLGLPVYTLVITGNITENANVITDATIWSIYNLNNIVNVYGYCQMGDSTMTVNISSVVPQASSLLAFASVYKVYSDIEFTTKSPINRDGTNYSGYAFVIEYTKTTSS